MLYLSDVCQSITSHWYFEANPKKIYQQLIWWCYKIISRIFWKLIFLIIKEENFKLSDDDSWHNFKINFGKYFSRRSFFKFISKYSNGFLSVINSLLPNNFTKLYGNKTPQKAKRLTKNRKTEPFGFIILLRKFRKWKNRAEWVEIIYVWNLHRDDNVRII